MPVPPIETTYTLTAKPNIIVRDIDGAHIPDDPANLDYQEHLRWLDEGNEPNPMPPDLVPPIEDVPPPDIVEVHAQVQDIDARLTDLETSLGR